MKRIIFTTIITTFFAAALFSAAAMAGPDQYIGDTAIYSGSSLSLQPNVLLLIDNSNATLNKASGTAYDPTHDYSGDGCASASGGCYSKLSVYQAGTQGDYSHSSVVDNATGNLNPAGTLPNITCNNNSSIVTTTLLNAGTYSGSGTANYPNLKNSKGKAVCDTAPKGTTYALGNFLNYTLLTPPPVLVQASDGKDYALIKSHTSTVADQPITGANWATYWKLNGSHNPTTPAWALGAIYDLGSDTQQKIIYDAIKTVVNGARSAVRFGAMVYGSNNKGGNVIYEIKDLKADADFNAFLNTLPGGTPGTAVLSSQTARPMAEALYDAGDYFKGNSLTISGQAAMTSPIQHSCDKNYIILVTNGLPNGENMNQLNSLVGDYDNDGLDAAAYGAGTHFLDDVAKKLYEADKMPEKDYAGVVRMKTHTILAFQADDPLVKQAANESHGRGSYNVVSNANELAKALTKVMSNIVLEADSSFVAPVVPVSPENRTYSGSRVYLGFFKPISQKPWKGNLKKYGINNSGEIVDAIGAVATNSSDGSFKSTAVSYWSASADGATVDKGGTGDELWSRNFTTDPRKIYTYMGTSKDLTNSTNAFTTTNANITDATLGSPTDGKDKLINFVTGIDSYDYNGDGSITDKRDWFLGDILHSKPLVINYATYTFTTANEADCTVNKTMIYVGANDGMLHAFKDCDGSEAWAFIPQDLLGNLKYMKEQTHTYFVDGSASLYKYDANGDGNIDSTAGDKAIIIFGERRGGGLDTGPTKGYYYALDVSDPASPKYMWRLSNSESPSGTNTDYSELGETWSEPKIVKMKLNVSGTDVDKIVAILGAGYDNCNEDARFGGTQTFTGSCVTSPTGDSGNVTSSGTTSASSLTNPKGRGIYVVEVAQLASASPFAPSFTNSGRKIWGYTYGASDTATTNTGMSFSIPSEVSAIDTDYNGYADRLYVGDMGGNIWRFDVGSTSTSSWTAKKIFSANPGSGGSTDVGRKLFYKPSAAIDYGYIVLAFGTGDREHPLNRAIVDRMYVVKDKGQTTTVLEDNTTYPDYKLVDVTSDYLQACTTDCSQVTSILSSLKTLYGWYIKLDENSGEKVLSPALLFNKIAYYTTYAPSTVVVTDPCLPGNLGTGFVYALNYATGEAIINYDTTNDSTSTTNKRATPSGGGVLLRSDRKMTVGSGIPSGIVVIVSAGGDAKECIGIGGGLNCKDLPAGGGVKPIYWRQD